MRDISGKRFGILVAIRPTEKRRRRNVVWLCECDCGNTIEVIAVNLIRGKTKSCGCHLHRPVGLSHHPLYSIWKLMKMRCYNSNNKRYKHYGGRGIQVCKRWLDKDMGFVNFLLDMGERPEGKTLDRIDNNGNYTPENCKWATYKEQNRNCSRNKLNIDKVMEIKKMIKDGYKIKEIANKFNVNSSMISNIKGDRIWMI